MACARLHAFSNQQVHGVRIFIWLSFLQNTVKWLNYFHLFDNLQPEILNKTDVLNFLYQIASRSLFITYEGKNPQKFSPAAGNYNHYLAAMSYYVINSARKPSF